MTTDPAEVLAQHLAREPVHRALIRSMEHRLFAEEKLERPILDVGCGDGHFAALTFPAGIEIGLDLKWAVVAEGRTNGPYRHADVADGTRLPYANAAFRTVVSNCVIEHIPDIEALVGEVARVLAPSGRFVFSVPNERFTDSLFTVGWLKQLGLEGLAARFGRWWNANATHFNLDGSDVWSARLARHGLTIVCRTPYMSDAATRALELTHYYAVPSLVWRKLSGQWTLRPQHVRRGFAFRWLLSYVAEPWPEVGACTFYVARK
jgi:SAM-dependent methyltransferase